jgi:hypothetical protein
LEYGGSPGFSILFDMKKTIITLIVASTAMFSIAYAQETPRREYSQYGQNCESVAYRLFPTGNMWFFIKLNTRNGQMWQSSIR